MTDVESERPFIILMFSHDLAPHDYYDQDRYFFALRRAAKRIQFAHKIWAMNGRKDLNAMAEVICAFKRFEHLRDSPPANCDADIVGGALQGRTDLVSRLHDLLVGQEFDSVAVKKDPNDEYAPKEPELVSAFSELVSIDQTIEDRMTELLSGPVETMWDRFQPHMAQFEAYRDKMSQGAHLYQRHAETNLLSSSIRFRSAVNIMSSQRLKELGLHE